MNRNLNTIKLKLKNSKTNFIKFNIHSYNTNIIKPNPSSNNLKWPTKEIRKSFLDHFCIKHKHKFINSSSVIPRKGSGTYFTNAGMNQFRSIILGEINSNDIIDHNKYIGVANSQKCIRIGGKHSDLDSIGKDDNHHTFFEMLGNWSFGKYGKEDACKFALELLIDTYKLNLKKLYFTYFAGNNDLQLSEDFETKKIWIQLGVPEKNIVPFGMKENFWEMDTTGPCGPCTEIHYDRTSNGAIELLNKGDERVIELWNLVFMQYNRLSQTSFMQLPELVVDTGMGLERLSAVLNNLYSNYEIDMFTPIFEQIENYLKNKNINIPSFHNCDTNSELKYAYRALTDHMRTITVAISDGLLPSRLGLGAYLRYLLTKVMKMSNDLFKIDKNQAEFLCSLVPVIIDTLKDAYPQLEADCERIQQVIKNNENYQNSKNKSFEEKCQRYFNKLNNPKSLTGSEIMKLHKGDASGEDIPIEYIENFAKKNSIILDRDGFDKLYVEITENSIENLKHTRYENTQLIKIGTYLKQKLHIPPTHDEFKYNFELDTVKHTVKYKEDDFIAKILCLIRINDDETYELVDHLENNQKCIIVLDRTKFYAEKGGQQADTGTFYLLKDANLQVKITNVQHLQDYSFHFGKFRILKNDLNELKLNKNDYCNLKIDEKKRYQTTLNHTAIHVLNDSLRKFYNNEDSIIQFNSSARDTNLKFEFLFNKIKKFSKPTLDDITNIQKQVQSIIDQALPIYENEIEYDNVDKYKIRKLRDILYPKQVRVVSVGNRITGETSTLNEVNFHELCCGTHATNTKDLEKFFITSIKSDGEHTFEIDACTGKKAAEIERNERIINDIYQEICEIDSTLFSGLHEIARKCIQIELLTQYWHLSYSFRNKLKNDLENYRPSKLKLQKYLHKYLHDQILNDEMIDAEDLYLKFITYNSILSFNHDIKALTKENRIPSSLIAFNEFRKYLIAYSFKNHNTNVEEHKKLFDLIETLLTENKVVFEIVKSKHSNINVFKLDRYTKPQKIIDICKNIEKI